MEILKCNFSEIFSGIKNICLKPWNYSNEQNLNQCENFKIKLVLKKFSNAFGIPDPT